MVTVATVEYAAVITNKIQNTILHTCRNDSFEHFIYFTIVPGIRIDLY